MRRLALLIIILLFIGCGNEPELFEATPSITFATREPPKQSESDLSERDIARGNGAGEVELPPVDEVGLACFGTRGNGAACLSPDGSWTTYTTENSHLGRDYITAMTDCHGEILFAHTGGLSMFDGVQWREYARGWESSSVEDVVCDESGGIWVAHFGGVAHFDGASWTTYSAETMLAGERLVYSVEIAADGSVWVLSSGAIAQFDGANWTTYSDGNGYEQTYSLDDLALDSEQTVWAVRSDGFLHFVAGRWEEIKLPSGNSPETLVIDQMGRKWIGRFSKGITIVDGATMTNVNHQFDGLSSDRIHSAAIDAAGRIWFGTEYGLSVWDGTRWHIYRMDNSGLVSNQITSLAIVDSGPGLPEPIEKGNGEIIGRIPTAPNTAVEICVEVIFKSYRTETPCTGQPFVLQTTTDAEGEFRFENVPVGRYNLTVACVNVPCNPTTKWEFLFSSNKQILVVENSVTDVGVVTDD